MSGGSFSLQRESRRPSIKVWPASENAATEEQMSLSPKISSVEQRTRQLEDERIRRSLKWTVGMYWCFVVLSVIGMSIGLLTTALYRFYEEAQIMDSDLQDMDMIQEFTMSLKGVYVNQEYCSMTNNGEDCYQSHDVFRSYEDAENTGSVSWSTLPEDRRETYQSACKDALGGASSCTQGVTWGFLLVAVALITMSCRFVKCSLTEGSNWSRYFFILAFWLHLLGCGLMGLGLWQWHNSSASMRAALEANPLLDSKNVQMKMGWSSYVCYGSVAILLLAVWGIWRCIPERLHDGVTIKMQERDQRVTKYFSDVRSTTYQQESRPVDTAASTFGRGAQRVPGWTTSIHSTAINKFTEEPPSLVGGGFASRSRQNSTTPLFSGEAVQESSAKANPLHKGGVVPSTASTAVPLELWSGTPSHPVSAPPGRSVSPAKPAASAQPPLTKHEMPPATLQKDFDPLQERERRVTRAPNPGKLKPVKCPVGEGPPPVMVTLDTSSSRIAQRGGAGTM